MKILKYLSVIAVFISVISCSKDQPEVEVSPVYPVAGEYIVTAAGADSLGQLDVLIFNTSKNSSDTAWMQIYDAPTGGGALDVKFKVGVSPSSLSFSVANAEDVNGGLIVSVTGGKVTKDSVKDLPSKTTSDGVSFSVVIDGNTYNCTGYRRTGWIADDPDDWH